MQAQDYPIRVQRLLDRWPSREIDCLVSEIERIQVSGHTLFILGNGGSASTASHIATDLGVGSLSKTIPIRVVSLTDNSAVLTATANDFGYEQVFARQIELLCNKNDIVLAISASGNSENLILGAKAARKRGCTTIGMTAFDGGLLRNLVDISIHVETEVGEYGPAEDVHSMIGHCVTELVRKKSAAL